MTGDECDYQKMNIFVFKQNNDIIMSITERSLNDYLDPVSNLEM